MRGHMCAADAISCDLDQWLHVWHRFLHVAPKVAGLIYVNPREDSLERMAGMLDTNFKQQTVPLLEKQIGDVRLDEVVDNAER
eukprot:8340656-Karenia_brevis.AAC.1